MLQAMPTKITPVDLLSSAPPYRHFSDLKRKSRKLTHDMGKPPAVIEGLSSFLPLQC